MDVRERLAAFWSGQAPDVIPYTIYDWLWLDCQADPAWQPLYAAGLGVVMHTNTTYRKSDATVQFVESDYQRDGRTVRRTTVRTPVGEAFCEHVGGWRTSYYLQTAADYRVLTYVARHSAVLPCYENYRAVEGGPRHQVPVIAAGRSPLQEIHVDWAGLENIAVQLLEMPEAVDELYEALRPLFARSVELIAAGPGQNVALLENYTAELGPRPYAKYLAPVYQRFFPELRRAGKTIGVHYDGRLAAVQTLVGQQPFHQLESLTPPPEGDMTLRQCRAAWPHLQFWHNLNVTRYQLPANQLRALVQQAVGEAAVDGRLLAIECSEERPANWKTSMPVVLEALRALGR